MIKRNQLPQNESQLLDWLNNFSALLPTMGKNLGITPAEISSLNALILSVKEDLINNRKSKENELKKEGMLSFVVMIMDRMKKHPDYNEIEHGKKMGIE